MTERPTALWRQRDFLLLWSGQTVSLFGSYVGRLALPLVAVLVLEATPAQVALLLFAELAPGLVLGTIAYMAPEDCRHQSIALRVPGQRYQQNGPLSREFGGATFERALSLHMRAGG